MKIINKVNKFYKLVASETSDAAEYQISLGIMMHKPTFMAIIEFLRDWSDTPFFRMDDIKDRLLDLMSMVSGRFKGQIDTWASVFSIVDNSEYISQELRVEIINLVAKDFISHSKEFLGQDYIAMEREPLLTPETLKAAQHRVLLEVMKELQNKDEESWVAPLELLQNLLISNKIPQHLVEGLAKRFGPEFYGALYSNSRGMRSRVEMQDFWKDKATLSIFDISEFLGSFSDYQLQSITIKQMIAKSDDQAKQYWRRLLFTTGATWSLLTANCFILSEDMTPMDESYNEIPWPDSVRVLKLSEIITNKNKDLADFVEMWKKIFHEFNIIPL